MFDNTQTKAFRRVAIYLLLLRESLHIRPYISPARKGFTSANWGLTLFHFMVNFRRGNDKLLHSSWFWLQDAECEICKKKVRKRYLTAHIKTHSEFKGLPCKFCGKEYPTIGSLTRHEKIHMDVKEHKCRFCGKCFVQKANMQAHERIHTGERPYKCQFCNEGFVQSTRRRQHEATCKMRSGKLLWGKSWTSFPVHSIFRSSNVMSHQR